MPSDEKFALINQLQRSVISLVLNIAEETGALGNNEFKSFLRNAFKSLYETVASIKIAEKLFQTESTLVLEKCNMVGKELNALIKSLKSND